MDLAKVGYVTNWATISLLEDQKFLSKASSFFLFNDEEVGRQVGVCYIWPVQAAGPCLMEPVLSGWSLGHPWYLGGYNRPTGGWRGLLTIYYISNIRPCSASRFTGRGSSRAVQCTELKNVWQFGEHSEMLF